MTRTWEFTDLEFKVLWERQLQQRILPEPLTYMSRTPLRDDYEREKFQIWERLRDTVDGSMREVLEVISRPEVLVKVLGWNDADQEDPQQWIRARGVRSGARGFLLAQQPGETPWHSSGYAITECGPWGVADAVVGLLPKTRPGRTGSIPILTDRVADHERFDFGGSRVTETASTSTVSRSDQFFAIPATRTGVITIHQGHSKFGPRGILERILVWRDLPDDGRYVIELDQAPVALGIGEGRLVQKIDDLIAGMLQRLETHWE
ncbi:ESX secretion-associated protein EspG [Nocardia sp. NPDC005998]|uniref:ESX secretion-associated protein EspG n=1 Tax=Nocardia sp. NPDC005998 TaxID=3156894 RepID=UPI0033A7B097